MSSDIVNREFFEDIIRKEFEKCTVKKFSSESAVPKGENYASVLTRVTIELDLPENVQVIKNYLVKSGQESEYSGYVNFTLFPKEKEMYGKILPQFEALFKEFGEVVQLAPRCHKILENHDIIVLEDLRPKKFVTIKRQLGMDMQHAKATLKKLAQFHAASACLYERCGSFSEKFDQGLYQEDMVPIYNQMFSQMWPLLYGSMKKWEGCEKYVEKIKIQKDRMIEFMMDSLRTNSDEFNVLNHGDFWSNNVMFRYNEDGAIVEVLLIDFQLCKWGSPIDDLQHFIISSCSPEIRTSKFEYLVGYYHRHLVQNLTLLHYEKKMPTLLNLQIDSFKRGYYCVNTSISILSAVLLDPEPSLQQRTKIYSNPRYVEAMKLLLPFFDNRGLLDL